MIHKSPVVRDIAFVTVFWYVVTTAMYFLGRGWREPFLNVYPYITATFGLLIVGVASGLIYAIHEYWSDHQYKRDILFEGGTSSGVHTSMGGLTIFRQEPQRSNEPIDISSIPNIAPAGPYSNLIKHGWLDEWMSLYGKSHPAHRNLMIAILEILNFYRTTVKAGYSSGKVKSDIFVKRYGYDDYNHAGLDILEHSFWTASVAVERSKSWQYRGIAAETENGTGKTVIPKNDPNYTFSPLDPVIGIVALAHDIGKIMAHYAQTQEERLQAQRRHGSVGPQLMARIEEFWEIPIEDREIINLSLAHYHYPHRMPLSDSKRLTSDRMMAILELTAIADRETGRIEHIFEKGLADSDAMSIEFDDGVKGRVPLFSGNEKEYREALYLTFTNLVNSVTRFHDLTQKGFILKFRTKQGAFGLIRQDILAKILLEGMGLVNSSKSRRVKGVKTIIFDLISVLSEPRRDIVETTFAQRGSTIKASPDFPFFNCTVTSTNTTGAVSGPSSFRFDRVLLISLSPFLHALAREDTPFALVVNEAAIPPAGGEPAHGSGGRSISSQGPLEPVVRTWTNNPILPEEEESITGLQVGRSVNEVGVETPEPEAGVLEEGKTSTELVPDLVLPWEESKREAASQVEGSIPLVASTVDSERPEDVQIGQVNFVIDTQHNSKQRIDERKGRLPYFEPAIQAADKEINDLIRVFMRQLGAHSRVIDLDSQAEVSKRHGEHAEVDATTESMDGAKNVNRTSADTLSADIVITRKGEGPSLAAIAKNGGLVDKVKRKSIPSKPESAETENLKSSAENNQDGSIEKQYKRPGCIGETEAAQIEEFCGNAKIHLVSAGKKDCRATDLMSAGISLPSVIRIHLKETNTWMTRHYGVTVFVEGTTVKVALFGQ